MKTEPYYFDFLHTFSFICYHCINLNEKKMIMKNILTMDLGNSDTVIVIYDLEGNVQYRKRQFSIKTSEGYDAESFIDILENYPVEVDLVVLSCVVPAVTEVVVTVLRSTFNCDVINVTAEYSGFSLGLEESAELGADFIASGWGALRKYKPPVIIVDMGTASKISIVDAPDKFLGGIIQPGLGTLAEVINSSIPHLPKVELTKPDSVIGYSTTTFLQSGIVYGAFESLRGMAERMERELGKECTIVFTGGYSNLYTDEDYIFHFDLVNIGLLEYGLRYEKGLIKRSVEGLYNFLEQRK